VVTVSAVIPTIPERSGLLEVALESVNAQTRPVDQVCVAVDTDHEGPAEARNRATLESACEWLAFLDDDDIWLPNHIQTCLDHSDGADVVYTDCDLVGDHHSPVVNRDFDPFALTHHNYIPVTALVRRSAFEAAGMFDPADRYEDWALWRRLWSAGRRFVHVPVVTWEYRFGGDQRTFKEG
jgi:glycosyltransferase involved in cell wall biosynthesis